MGKNRLALHCAAILAIAFFAFLAISSTASTPKSVAATNEETVITTSKTTSRGIVNNMPGPNERQFETLGLVFATSVTKFDEKGLEISSQEGIVTMLLREAQRLGGNDILNLRVDENITFFQTTVTTPSSGSSSSSSTKTITTKTVTYTGSALAVKYR
jgi:hypothetical protein